MIAIILAVYFFAIAYVTTNQWVIAFIALFIVFLDVSIFIQPKFKKAQQKRYRAKEAYFFIQQMIIGLSVHQSVQKAFYQICDQQHPDFLKELKAVEPLDGCETLKYLGQYFPLKIYDMFLHLLDIYVEQGTDILQSSDLLREQLALQERQLMKQKALQDKTLIENIVLWIFSTLIVVACRYGIADFFLRMLENPWIVGGFCLYLLFVLITVHQLASMYIRVDIPGWKNEINESNR